MTSRRPVAVLGAVALAIGVLAGCGDDDPQSGAPGTTPQSTAPLPAPTSTAPGDGAPTTGGSGADASPFPADTRPDTGEPSAGSAVTVTDVRTARHDGFDRVVFEVDGTGSPGWDVRYVDEATSQGSGAVVPVEGDAVLQVTITGVGLPTDTGIEEYDGSDPLPGTGTEVVTEVVWDTTFEGTSVAFVGTTSQVPFRAYLLEDPARVVVDLVHPA
ncbi:hypothetical protein E9549_20020 [Blastococcus sp. MG754426]|uniref:AMIN-like domain-containing (lipo)protein n=1 Tax=unclassified Blastococcus TaxID=2619396 RepID=UPI001EF01CB6|nr:MULTISPECIES: hypothetical protein [unclassified Blastococcus]MCF6509662.1 hypothetical protein [Blastococcus sp. MG754426]MCF6510725.1 hypothetical protein [Blastococcus sp. MG754427]